MKDMLGVTDEDSDDVADAREDLDSVSDLLCEPVTVPVGCGEIDEVALSETVMDP